MHAQQHPSAYKQACIRQHCCSDVSARNLPAAAQSHAGLVPFNRLRFTCLPQQHHLQPPYLQHLSSWCWPHDIASPHGPLVLLDCLTEPAGLQVRLHLQVTGYNNQPNKAYQTSQGQHNCHSTAQDSIVTRRWNCAAIWQPTHVTRLAQQERFSPPPPPRECR